MWDGIKIIFAENTTSIVHRLYFSSILKDYILCIIWEPLVEAHSAKYIHCASTGLSKNERRTGDLGIILLFASSSRHCTRIP